MSTAPYLLELCCGYANLSRVAREMGWEVYNVDVLRSLNPSECIDVRQYTHKGRRPDLVWASPPCTEFARESMPWCATGIKPDTSIVMACLRIITETNPRWWILENVRGAQPYIGMAPYVLGPYYLWGWFPPLYARCTARKQRVSGKFPALRASIPASLCRKILLAVANLTDPFAVARGADDDIGALCTERP